VIPCLPRPADPERRAAENSAVAAVVLLFKPTEGSEDVQQLPSRNLGQTVVGLLLPNFYPFL